MTSAEHTQGRQEVAAPTSKLPLIVLLADTFTMALGFYMLIPLLAFHLLDDLSLTVVVVGILAAVRSGTQQGLMPWSGTLADRFGHRRAIATGVLVRAGGFALFAFVESVPGLVVACVLAGLGGSLFHPASYAMYAVLAQDRNRVTVYSWREMLSNLGFVLGPLLGGLLAGIGFSWVCLASAALFVAAFLITVIGLPRDHPRPRPGDREAGRGPLRSALLDRRFRRFCLAVAGGWVLFSQLYLVVPLRAADVLPSTVGIGSVYSVAAVVMVVTMLPLAGAADRWLRPETALALGTLGLGAGLLLLGVWPSVSGLVAGVVVFTLGQALFQPIMNSTVSSFAREDSIASYFGVHGLALALGGILGGVGGGLLYGVAERGTSLWLAHLPEVVFTLWSIGVAILLLRRERSSDLVRPTDEPGDPGHVGGGHERATEASRSPR